jgi:autotransporter-associated beta strand protein
MGLGIAFGLLAGADSAFAAFTCRWVGNAGDTKWSTAANWADCGAPGNADSVPHSGDTIEFLDHAATAGASDNDLVGLSLAGLLLDGESLGPQSWTITGNGITLTGNLTAQNIPNTTTVSMPITVGAPDLTIQDLSMAAGQHEGLAIGAVDLNGLTLTFNAAFPIVVNGAITGHGNLVKNGPASLRLDAANTYTGATAVNAGVLALTSPTGQAVVGTLIIRTGGSVATAGLFAGSQLDSHVPVTLTGGTLALSSASTTIGSLGGTGTVALNDDVLTVGANNILSVYDGTITGIGNFVKIGTGIQVLTGAHTQPATTVTDGTLLINGSLSATGTVTVTGGILGGTGSVGTIMATGGTISPGLGPNVLHPTGPASMHAGAATLTDATLVAEINGLTPGTGYDQLALAGNLTLGGTVALQATLGFEPRNGASFTLIDVAAGKTVTGTFMGLAEGATLHIGDRQFTISYRGGDGNDVVLTAADEPPAVTYYLSEGATGGFFDEDVLIANPNDTAAPVTLTFSKEDGQQVQTTRTVPAQAHLTVHVDQIAGLEATSASAQITSEAGWPLVVERSMFWDSTYYAGHTGSAVDHPAADWFFAEGSQGFFDTFVLVINPNATAADVTFTFFRENEPAVVKTMTVGATTRLTLHAGDVPDLVNRSFGIAVHATQPIMAERSMYFGTTPSRLWSGGHESAGVTAPARRWFLAEGATGGFFDTFILISNPQSTPVHVLFTYLLDTGEKVEVPRTIAANARLTTNIEAEDDVRLHTAAVSTIVEGDQPIIVERSMYWPGAAVPWGEGHNSLGVTEAGTRWGLSEGRTGGPLNFHTYILLANPQTTVANVTVHYLRESGAPVAKTYTVAPTSRFNIDINTVTELLDESFGAVIEVTNGVPIIVERSMYWDSNGFSFSGGTNATGIRLFVP